MDNSFGDEWHIQLILAFWLIWIERARWLEPYEELKRSDLELFERLRISPKEKKVRYKQVSSSNKKEEL